MKPKSRPVLIVVPKWPDGTMAIKFGSAMMSALGVQKGDAALLQFRPERVFRVETEVSEKEFLKAMKLSGVSWIGPLYFFDVGTQA